MGNKILVTKEWHKKALRALLIQEAQNGGDLEIERLVFKIFKKYMEDECTEEEQERFVEYVENYVDLMEEK